MLTRRSEPGPSQSMEAQSGLEVKNDAMVFDVVDPSVVFVAFVFFVGGAVEVDDNHDHVDDDGHLDSPLPSLGRRS